MIIFNHLQIWGYKAWEKIASVVYKTNKNCSKFSVKQESYVSEHNGSETYLISSSEKKMPAVCGN